MVVVLGIMSLTATVGAAELPALPPLMISELQLSGLNANGATDGQQEFVELYNPGTGRLDVAGWRLEYLSAAHTGVGAPTRVLAEINGVVDPFSFVLMGPAGLADADASWSPPSSASGQLAQGGGHVRLVDASGKVVDLVGWGSGSVIGDWTKVAGIPAGQSAQRVLPHNDGLAGAAEYRVSPEISPTGGGLVIEPHLVHDCSLRLSEIMPNPAGADSGHEYIELYNPTEAPQPLADCALRIGDAADVIDLPDLMVMPHGYITVGDDVGFSLSNVSGAIVWLLGGSFQQSVRYADALQDDQVWWLQNGVWAMSRTGTPGAANELQPEKTPPTVLAAVHLPDDCPVGKERNVETGRCRNIPAVSTTEPCGSDQVRNGETGRCRAITATGTIVPTACKPGQERNPVTNRCRNIITTSAAPKPCPEGQVRNTETNRCRKQGAASVALAKVEDVSSGGQAGIRWGVVSVAFAGLVGYALYEWRQEVINILQRHQSKVSKRRLHWKFWQERGTITNK